MFGSNVAPKRRTREAREEAPCPRCNAVVRSYLRKCPQCGEPVAE